VLIVEVKSSPADFRADRKWRDYVACCDRLYFAISERTPAGLMPLEAGLIVADSYGAEIVREAELQRMAPASRRALLLRFARLPPTGCTVWPIPGRRRNLGALQLDGVGFAPFRQRSAALVAIRLGFLGSWPVRPEDLRSRALDCL